MSVLTICIDRDDFPSQIPHKFFLPDSAPVVLCGPTEYLSRKKVAILNSRQSPRITKHSHWVQNTIKALLSLDPSETTLVASLGTSAWEFLSWKGNKLKFPVILVFPGGSAQNFKISRTKAIMNLNLNADRTLAIRPLLLKKYRNKTELNSLRDTWIMALAQSFFPVSIKSGGNLDGYLSYPDLVCDHVQHDFAIEYERALPVRKPKFTKPIVLPDWYESKAYLIHWTRSCVGPWPEETMAEHFEQVLSNSDSGATGFQVLERIIRDGKIRASNKMIRGRHQVVPFTERPPGALPDLIKWRAGLHRWTFEPYGLAISRKRLIEMGARPVSYGNISTFEAMAADEQQFFQFAGSGKHDWREEKEWRISGDVDLDSFQADEVVLIVHNKSEMNQLQDGVSCRVFCLSSP